MTVMGLGVPELENDSHQQRHIRVLFVVTLSSDADALIRLARVTFSLQCCRRAFSCAAIDSGGASPT